jgi:replicative DNA helicase
VTTDTWDIPVAEPDDQPPDLPGRFDRPSSIHSERILAASIMLRPDLIDDLADTFDPVDFSDRRLAWIWHAVEELRNHLPDGPVGWVAVDQQLSRWRAEGHLPVSPIDAAHLSALSDEAMPATAPWHAAIVTAKAEGSRLVDVGLRAQQRGMSTDFDAARDVPAVQEDLDAVVRGDASNNQPALIRDLYAAALEAAVTPPAKEDRVPTGLADLDALLGDGFAPGRFVIVGARPGVGKTTLGNNFARAAAIRAQLPTLFVSLEMSRQELMACILAAEAKVPLHHISHGTVSPENARRLTYLQDRIDAAPLYIDDATTVSLATLRGQVRHLVRKTGLRMLVVDYLQLMQVPRAENRQVAVSALSRGLKLLAKEFGIVVVALCQLNRGSQQRTDKRPTISDLRESGSLEQDADMVILLHREDMHEAESARAGEIELIVDKHRGGPRATLTCAYQGHYARVIDMGGFEAGNDQ